ncbi:hypothetical protein MCCARTNEY_229 [Bacillus phage vB_BanH_McCartney]|nr:hypothetical protein MCCARTNEY_229 [Bacillus phage vB_BanH_McCartney]
MNRVDDFRSVTFDLQNREKVTVDKLMITVLRLKDISFGVHIEGGEMYNVIAARRAGIRIRKTCSKGGDSVKFTARFEKDSAEIVRKLKESDIISVTFNLEDGEKEEVMLYWGATDFSEEGEVRNPNQENSIEETTGDFCIGIGY